MSIAGTAALSAHNHATLVGKSFFAHLISEPFRSGLHEAFAFAIIACLIAAAASLMPGGRYHAQNVAGLDVRPRTGMSTTTALGRVRRGQGLTVF